MNHTYPLVTIGIPTYNRADSYLSQALQSAVDQTYPRIEIVVSDNCSTDQTETVVNRFADPRIRYFKHPCNIGPANNFNFCLEQAQGTYFLLLHDDDLIDNDFVESCLRQANYAPDFGLIRTGTREIDAQGRTAHEAPNLVGGLAPADFFRGWFAYKTSIYLCSTLYHTQRLRELGGLHSKHELLQDVVAIVQLATRYDRVDVREIKASFRKHEGELTFAIKVSKWGEDFLSVLDLMAERLPEHEAVLRAEGSRFFAKLCYHQAQAMKSPWQRWMAYLIVFRKFEYKYLPPPLYYFIQRRKRTASRILNLARG